MKNRFCVFFLFLLCLPVLLFITDIDAQGTYVRLDEAIVEEVHQQSAHEWAATIRLEYSGFPMKEPDKILYHCTGTGCNPNGGVINPGEFKDYEYVDSYHGKVWVGADGMMDERYEIEFQVVLNGLTSNKKSVVIFYRTP